MASNAEKTKYNAPATIADYEHQLARLRSQSYSDHRGHKKWYERNRLLEGRIRGCVQEHCGHKTKAECLQFIAAKVPMHPRKKWGWRSR